MEIHYFVICCNQGLRCDHTDQGHPDIKWDKFWNKQSTSQDLNMKIRIILYSEPVQNTLHTSFLKDINKESWRLCKSSWKMFWQHLGSGQNQRQQYLKKSVSKFCLGGLSSFGRTVKRLSGKYIFIHTWIYYPAMTSTAISYSRKLQRVQMWEKLKNNSPKNKSCICQKTVTNSQKINKS